MATTKYADDQVRVSPPWLQGPNGAAWASALGDLKDSIVTQTVEAVKARFPNESASDALPRIGNERGLPRGVGEPEAQYRARLVAAWEQWAWAGTPYGMLRAFQLAGFPTVLLQTQSGRMQYFDVSSALVTNVISGAHLGGTPTEQWSDFAVLIPQPWPSWWGGSAPVDGSADCKTAQALIKQWKPGHTRCVKLIVINGPVWGYGGLLWGAFTWGSGTTVTWTPPAG
jgi:hypothetical protein